MAIQIYYDSISQAAEAFGCSRQWLSKLIASGQLIAYDIPGQPQAKRVWHQHVAEALAKNGGLRPHSCVCFDFALQQGIEEGRQESAPQLAQVQQELAEAREEFAKVQAQLVEVEGALTEAAQIRPDPADPVSWRDVDPQQWTDQHWAEARAELSSNEFRAWRYQWGKPANKKDNGARPGTP